MTVGTISHLAGVTVRTLHHYHQIGLVVPSDRSEAGYRLYGHAEIERLQEVLFFRELGFGLNEIREIMESPDYDRVTALSRQRQLLEARAERLFNMITAVDATLEAERRGINMTKGEMLEVFGDFDPAAYEDEARERWGHTDAYQESVRRTAQYSKADWEQLGRESEEISQAFIELMNAGVSAENDAAMDVAERHRAHVSRWFYECTPEIHAGLGQMYVTDPRFEESIDRAAPGLAEYMSNAIAANSRRS